MKLIGSVRILQTDRVSVRLPALDRRVGQLLPHLQYRLLVRLLLFCLFARDNVALVSVVPALDVLLAMRADAAASDVW